MIEYFLLSLLTVLCLLGARSPALAAAIVVVMFPMEQIIQAAVPYLRTGMGSVVVNAGVAASAVSAVVVSRLRGHQVGRGFLNRSTVACIGLYAWSLVTVVWSPAKETAMKTIWEGVPYLFLHVFIAPLLFDEINDLVRCCRYILILGIIVGLGFIANPEFVMRAGRLVIDLGGGVSSSPLAVGELGGSLLIVSALAHRGSLGVIGLMLQVAGLLVGLVVALKSGSRGQFIFAIPVAFLFLPVASPIKNLRNFLASTVAITAIAFLADFLYSNLLENNEAKRFSVDSMLYGSSSAMGRVQNVFALALEWLSSPFSLLFGTGYSSFASLPESGGQDYSHVLFADALFELGVPGALLLAICLLGAVEASRTLFRRYRYEPGARAAVASFMALGVYGALLVNKQGSLWNVPLLFFFTSALARSASRIDQNESYDELQVVADGD